MARLPHSLTSEALCLHSCPEGGSGDKLSDFISVNTLYALSLMSPIVALAVSVMCGSVAGDQWK